MLTSSKRSLTAGDFPLGRDDDGWPLCRICGSRVPTKRNRTCSEECRGTIHFMCYVNVQKWRVFGRDKGVCARCGIDTLAEYKKHNRCPQWGGWHELGCWHMDHIVPVSEGGGVRPGMTIDEAMSNLRTLCEPCHKAETKAWHGRRSARRMANAT